MAVKKGGLGKGLDSLIPMPAGKSVKTERKTSEKLEKSQKPAKIVEKVVEKVVEKPTEIKLKINEVEPNRDQPRKAFEEEALMELADSIKQFGIIQPILVQPRDDYHEIIAGERRWRAAKIAGLKEIPVVIKEFTEQEAVEIALIENIQRENLNPIEEAVAYKRLLMEFNLKQDEVAGRVSKSRAAVTNAMRLLKLDPRVQEMVIDEMISTGHARALLAFEDEDMQHSMAMKVYNEKLSVRETEKLAKSRLNPKVPQKRERDTSMDAVYGGIAERIKTILGTKVEILHKGNKGKIQIEYYSSAELDRLLDLLDSIK
jgi:ParB-like partition proteins